MRCRFAHFNRHFEMAKRKGETKRRRETSKRGVTKQGNDETGRRHDGIAKGKTKRSKEVTQLNDRKRQNDNMKLKTFVRDLTS